jgi:RNA ligase (TIGR02306 family)
MRQLATIQTVADVQPIENADAIEKIRVRDWWCVAKKGEFSVGQPCVYFEIDSLLPNANPVFDFLAKGSKVVTILKDDGGTASGYRLKTVRLRGQISQGLALPLSAFGITGDEGTDVSDALGILKWEPPISKQLATIARGPFPCFIPKTDEERVQNLRAVVQRHAGELFYVTEKLDGTSATFYRTEETFGACSRNIDLLDGNLYWDIARLHEMEIHLPIGYAIQGEIIGEAIQGNPLKRKGQKFYAFNVYDIATGRFLGFREYRDFCTNRGVSCVPVVDTIELPSDVEALIAMADGKSALNPEADREGVVFRPLVEQYNEIGGQQRRLSFKAVSNRYLLKGDR